MDSWHATFLAAPTHTAERDRVDEEANVAPLLWFIGGVSVLRTSCVARRVGARL
jgi:hypothetical protein